VFLLVSALTAVSLAVASGLSITEIHHVEKSIDKIDVGPGCAGDCLPNVEVTQECLRGVCNFLVLGSDSRAGLSPKEASAFGNTSNTPGKRADTIIVVHVDPVHDRTVVLSIPRDLRVDIPGHGENKINTAFTDGPNVLVRVVEKLTGLQIDHYVQVDFVGFQNLVNALGGVPICINRPLTDPLSGLNLPHKGCYNLKGAQALAFVRARHIQGDIIPDFSRIARQQQFIRAVIQKTLSIGAILHFPALIRAVQKNLVIDKNLNLYSLQDLTRKLTDLGQRGVAFRVVPATPVTIGGEDFVDLIQPDASLLFQRIRLGRRLGNIGRESLGTAISPANVTVQVYDANSNGKADAVVSYLERAGFVVLPVATAPAVVVTDRGSVLWRAHTLTEAQTVLSYLPATLPVDRYDALATAADVGIVVGPGFPAIEG
jgi:LCP family protein required for cell wall assembly